MSENSKYINSGILEAYALGMLSAEENQEVEEEASANPNVREALLQVEKTLEGLAHSHTTTPKPEWKSQIIEKATGKAYNNSESTAETKQIYPKQDIAGGRNYSWLAVAATILLLFSLGINFIQYRSVRNLEDESAGYQMRISELQTEKTSIVTNNQQLENRLEMLRDPRTSFFVMRSVEGRRPGYRANVMWNAASEKVYLDVLNLPEPPPGKQYQLWALKDTQTMDMGMVDMEEGDAPMKEMGEVEGADSFAITLEPKGGSSTPNMDQMYVHGGAITI